LSRHDQLFIARHAPIPGDFLIADYCFLTECFPFALRPEAETAVIMHDRFSSRAWQFRHTGKTDSVASLGEAEEVQRLASADTIVAIQAEEGEWVRRRLPDRNVLVAPMAAYPVAAPQPGRGDRVLFVGSAAAPNVDGIKWCLETSWPLIRRCKPDAVLYVAGAVCSALGPAPAGVKFLGFVDNLAPLYAEAGVVISPLRVGSGLKIKLIEALSHGKALIGTSKTLEGVEPLLADSILLAETPEDFATAVSELLDDPTRRCELATRALEALARHFSPQACYGAFVDQILGSRQTIPRRPGLAANG
jgi:succinoglycan biosynthesis protein ExoO